jgi:hypothetical protein
MKYFAIPTDSFDPDNPYKSYNWLSYINVYDGGNYVATTSHSVELKTTTALTVIEPDIDFGNDLFVGDNTGSDNSTTTVVNAGNSPIDAYVSGTDLSGFPSGNLEVDNIKYSLTENFNYTATGTALKTGGDPVDVDAPKPTSDTDVIDSIYWGIGIPYGKDASTYNGQNIFAVDIDSEDWPEL